MHRESCHLLRLRIRHYRTTCGSKCGWQVDLLFTALTITENPNNYVHTYIDRSERTLNAEL